MSNKILKWLILLALVLLIISFLIFWFGGSSFRESGVELSIDAPAQAMVGDEVAYKIKYTNSTKTNLTDLKFSFSYPSDSVVLKDNIVSSNQKEDFNLDKLSPGQSGEKDLQAFLVGDRGDIKTVKITLSYKAGDLKSEFQKTVSFSTTIIGLPISLTLVSPPNAVSGQTVNYILDYRNESGNDISDLRFEFNYPDGFTVQSSTPTPVSGNNIWQVPLAKKNQGSRISIQGVLTGKQGEAKPISITLKRKIGNQYVNYERASSSSVITNPLLGADIIVNDSKDYSSLLGDDLNYTVKYSNNSNYNLVGLNLQVKLEGDMYDFASLNTNGGFYNSSDNTILWNASSVPDFSNLSPNKKGQVTFKLKLKPSFPSSMTGSKNTFVKASVRFSTPNVPSGVDGDEIFATASLVTKISTQPVFNVFVYYNDPAYGTSGPLPPEVGKETVFTIHWQLMNPGNDVSEAKISGVLPTGVTWKGVTSVATGQPEVTFNKNTSEVVWDFKTLPQGVGSIMPKYEATFQVSIIPSTTQKGNPLTLIRNAKFSGKDSYTKQTLIVSASEITTNDLIDRPGEGVVQ